MKFRANRDDGRDLASTARKTEQRPAVGSLLRSQSAATPRSRPGSRPAPRAEPGRMPSNVSGTKSRSEPNSGPERLIPCAPRTKRTSADAALRAESENSEHIRRSGPIRAFREPLATMTRRTEKEGHRRWDREPSELPRSRPVPRSRRICQNETLRKIAHLYGFRAHRRSDLSPRRPRHGPIRNRPQPALCRHRAPA